MPGENRKVRPGPLAGVVVTDTGKQLVPPADWELLPPGDGALTKLVKSKGPSWLVQIKVGRRTMSRGVWASKVNIHKAVEELKAKRTDPGYDLLRLRQQAVKAKKQQIYIRVFHDAVLGFLDFHPRFSLYAENLAEKVTALATPVGSGTVARTERISLPERAKAAVIAWLRHQTTSYDRMIIARVKGRRREVRRQLAVQSLELLIPYRLGRAVPENCPLARALANDASNQSDQFYAVQVDRN